MSKKGEVCGSSSVQKIADVQAFEKEGKYGCITFTK